MKILRPGYKSKMSKEEGTATTTTATNQKRKRVDPRIRTMLENNVKLGHRTFLVMIGDKGKEQVANLHYMLTKSQVAKRPTVLWCFKKELEFSSHRKKRMKQMKKAAKGLKRDAGERLEDDPFELFLTSTSISYCYYHETDRILGNTFGMCILQDFEALTPNLLARTIETVQGGGLVVLLLKTMTSLKQLYTMTMDVHARYRTESLEHDPVARFNERFLLSLPGCESCLIVNDELDVLPLTGSVGRNIKPIDADAVPPRSTDFLDDFKNQTETHVNQLIALAKTKDQASVIKQVGELLSTQPLRTTISLTAGRGRGKSAAVGLALACAVQSGYANIFVTSPTPENLKTVFEFCFKGLEALGYEEHLDYDVIQSTQVELAKAIVRVNVHKQKGHRQTILYIQPQDYHMLGQAELVAIDEAAAIPLPLVQALSSGPQTVLMASTINGYEGTGRSLSLKLLNDLRKGTSSRTLREFTLQEPIRYNSGDPVESWLNKVLCLDSVSQVNQEPKDQKAHKNAMPHPDACSLYLVNRDTLFSYHKAAEAFLQRLVSLYTSSHYKNTPNDLQLMSDAPGHLLFVLLAPGADQSSNGLPNILCFVQVALEGQLAKESIMNSFRRGKRAAGDLIPWAVTQQFQDDRFGGLSGARIVRIAVNPDCQGMGYGTRAMRLLEEYFMGESLSVDDPVDPISSSSVSQDMSDQQELKPRSNLKPLLTKTDEVKPLLLNWLGVSFGLTHELWRFYKRLKYRPVYLRQTVNDITGEHTVIVLKALGEKDQAWLAAFGEDFDKRFLAMLSFPVFQRLPVNLCLSLIGEPREQREDFLAGSSITPYDVKRLEAYANNSIDHHMIGDLLPVLAERFFLHANRSLLSPVQAAILTAMGLQRKSVEMIEKELSLPVSQILAMLTKAVKRIVAIETARCVDSLLKLDCNAVSALAADANEADEMVVNQLPDLEEELEEEGDKIKQKWRLEQRKLVDSLDLEEYAITASSADLERELARKNPSALDKMTVSVPSDKKKRKPTEDVAKALLAKHSKQSGKAKNMKKKH